MNNCIFSIVLKYKNLSRLKRMTTLDLDRFLILKPYYENEKSIFKIIIFSIGTYYTCK